MINTPEPRIKLTNSERDSATWDKLKKHIEKRMHQLRLDNDADKDAIATANLRGRIAEMKALLTLDKDS